MESLNDCSTYSHHHWYSLCASIMLKHNVLYQIFYCSVNRYHHCHCATGLRSNTTSTLPPSWTSHHSSVCKLLPSCANSPAAEILYATHSQFCHTALYIEIYSWSRSCCTLCQRVCQVELLSRIRTSVPKRCGSKALQLALHDWSESFFLQ